MKFSKSLFTIGFLTLVGGHAAYAAGYVSSFDSPPFNGPDTTVVEVDGWSLNDTNTDIAAITTTGLISGNPGLVFGDGIFAPPDSTNTTIALSNTYTEFIKGTSVIFNFSLVDSTAATLAAREQFGFSVQSAAGSIAILFIPIETTALNARWEVGYSVNGGPATLISSSIGLENSVFYTFKMDIATGVSPLTSDVVVNVSGATGGFTAAVDPNANANSFSFLWTDAGAPGFNDSYFLADNLAVVPEPSALILLGVAGLGFAGRRRRI